MNRLVYCIVCRIRPTIVISAAFPCLSQTPAMRWRRAAGITFVRGVTSIVCPKAKVMKSAVVRIAVVQYQQASRER